MGKRLVLLSWNSHNRQQWLWDPAPAPPLPPLGHIWDVMLVWRKGNITVLCTIQFCVLFNSIQLPSVILGSSTEAWHICSTLSCTGSMFRSESSISSEWQFTGVSKARLPNTSWTAATPRRTLPVVSDFDLPAAIVSSYHDIVVAHSAVGCSPSPVWCPGMCCLMTSETCRSVPTISGRR